MTERIYQLSRTLVEKGHDCAIMSTDRGWDDTFINAIKGLEGVSIPCINQRYMVPDIGKTSSWLNSNVTRFDVVHLAGNWSVINILVYKKAMKLDIPYVFSAMGWLDIAGRSRIVKRLFRSLWTRPMLRDAAAVIAISPREVDDYRGFGVEDDKIRLIPNGISEEGLLQRDDRQFRLRFGLDARKIVLYIGRLSSIKGADLLIEAYSLITERFPDYQLVIFGNDHGGFQDQLEAQVRSLGVTHLVRILPPVFGVEKSWAYHAAELMVIPSRFDTMTIVALEASVCGCPILLTANCDFQAIEEHGGGLVVPATVEGIAEGLNRLLPDDVDRRSMGEMGREFVLREYGWNGIGEDFLSLFREIRK